MMNSCCAAKLFSTSLNLILKTANIVKLNLGEILKKKTIQNIIIKTEYFSQCKHHVASVKSWNKMMQDISYHRAATISPLIE